MDNLLARALARTLYSGDQRVEAELPSKLPSEFVATLVQQLDLEHETQAANLPYSIWVRSKAADDNDEIERRHVKQPGEVVKFRNNHPRILVYREGDYEPIAGVGGSSRNILPAGFPLDQSRDVALEALVEKALDILEEADPEWNAVRTDLSTEFTAVLRNWAAAMDALSGQELNWNDAWWRYAIIAMEKLGAFPPSTIAAQGATSAASLAGSYPLPSSQPSIADSKWKRLEKVITAVLSRTSIAIEATTRFEARSGEKHPVSWLDLEKIDLLTPQGPSDLSGNLGLVIAALPGKDEKCWGKVTEEHLDSLVSIVSEKGNQASISRLFGGNTISLPCSGASGNRPTFLLPIMEWEPDLEENLLVSEVPDLELLLPWSSSRDEESPLPTIPDGSDKISVTSSPATGLKVSAGAESASNEGLRVQLSLRVAFKVNSVWKTGPFQVKVEVPASHPGVADLEKAYEARIVLPVPWGITAVCSYGSNRNKVSATSDSAFKLDDGVISRDELGMVTIREPQEPVLADLLVYDATQTGNKWPAESPAILVDDCPPSGEWEWCWQGTGIELSKGPCVEDSEEGTILEVDVQEPDNRPFLPLIATLQDKSPSNLTLPDSSFGEHSLIAKMDALLADHLLCREADGPHGLAQIVAIPGSYSLGNSLMKWGNVLWPFEQDPNAPLDLRNAASGPSESFLQSEEAIAFKKVLAKLCKEASALPSKTKPVLLARKQLLGLSRELVVSYLESYASMVRAARNSGSHGDLFWATQPCSVIFAEGTTAQKQVSACLLSPFHPIRLGWLYSCEVVFSELHRSRIALAQVAEGWNFPAISQAPSQQNLPQSALMAIPLDPGPEQLFLGWSLMVNCKPGDPSPIEVPSCEYGELHIPGGATSGISPGGVSTALSDYLRSYPHLGSLVLELTNLQPGQRSSSLDQAVIEKVHSLSKGKLGVNSVRVIDDPNRRGTPPSQEDSLLLFEQQSIGKGIERFEWIRRAIGDGSEGYTDIRFVEDAAAQFSTLDEDESRIGVGSTPSWALRRFTRRSYPKGDINCHILEYDLCPPGNEDDPLQEAFHQAISATERTREDKPRAISIYATLDNLVGDNAPGVEWVVIGNVGLDVATLSALSSHGQRLLWEWRPPFIDSSSENGASIPDLSRRSFTCIASISNVLSGHIAKLHGVNSDLAVEVLEQLGARGVGLASLLSVDDKHAEGALGFFLAFEVVDKALSKIREKNSNEVDLILPMDAIDPFLRAMATSEPEGEEYSRKKADLLIARITPPGEDTEEDWNVDLIPVEITCRGFTNPAKENFIGAGSGGVKSKQVQLENSFNTVSRAIAQMEDEDSAGQAAWVSALGCVLEMGLMLGLPGQPTLPLDLPELVAALSSKRVDLSVHPGLLLWFAHLQDSPSHESLKLPPPGDPRERPHRAIFVSPSLPGSDGGRWSDASVEAAVRAIELNDDDTPSPAPVPKPDDDQGTEGDTGGLESSSKETTTKGSKDDTSSSGDTTKPSRINADGTGTSMSEHSWWSPLLNKFGMIGQLDVIEELNSQVQLASAMGNRLPDQLFVGPAGVGKSTIARKLADGLGLRLIEMNGASLRNGGDLIKRLEAEELLGPPEGTRVNILPSVVFIDEVHAIGTQVHDLLLSALDNRRVASHQAEEYSFDDVIILLATTDPGKLSDAFTSRPRQVSLSAYSLEELAAIVLLHGRDHLGGYELPREICIEVAARNRANPRQSVRCLTDSLVAHFFDRLSREGREFQGLEKDEIRLAIGQAMSLEAVCAYFDKQGIDRNGIDRLALKMLKTLHERGSLPQESLMKACGISNNRDFVATWEYCQRLGLVEVAGGRGLTDLGHTYVLNPGSIDLRDRIV